MIKDNDLIKVMDNHYKNYPEMTFQDMIKLIYQNSFGSGHMISDEEKSYQRLLSEYQSLNANEKDSSCLFEPIGNQLCRLNLKMLTKDDLKTANRFFVLTAQRTGTHQDFEYKLNVFLKQVQLKRYHFQEKDLSLYLAHIKNLGYPATHHSEHYNRVYHPAYRVVDEIFSIYYDVFKHINNLRQKKETVVVAIDGQCGSGKSTLGHLLQKVYGCDVFKMDDFYLSDEMKTKQRMAEPGGNVDYVRFKKDVLEPLKNHQKIQYKRFNCMTQTFEKSQEINPSSLVVVEGSYAMHPTLVKSYDLKIFLLTTAQVQKKRILKRNGLDGLKRFESLWIPLENTYFEVCLIKNKADLVIDTSMEKILYF